ncbi:DUF4138 domain-containing protein (plasmid) [Segatella hominis]|nr:DUF4138 domain-containing protein [Segatella hominis]WOZ83151.1 DUF4138 domain-containing protein [Segatella hominis]
MCNGGRNEKYTFRFENISFRFTIDEHFVLRIIKMTFPNDKVLSISLSEKQISGRNISINLDYEDLLAADSFDSILLREQ